MALNPDACGVIDPSIPQWKRELIIRRRALGRTLQVGSSSVKLTCPAVVAVVRQPELIGGSENIISNKQKCSPTAEDPSFSSLNQNRVDFHPGPSSAGSVSNMRLLDSCDVVDNLVINNGIDAKNKQSGVVTNNSETSVNFSLIMGEDKSLNLKKKCASKPKPEQNNCNFTSRQRFLIEKVSSEATNGKSSKDEDCLSDSSEELQYGPGIVNKLKTKYLSMTLREQKRNSRPSIASLRRATSLENMLEGDGNLNEQNKIITEVKVKADNVSLNERNSLVGKPSGFQSSHRAVRNLGTRRLETMKRAQSMDTLLKSEVRATLKPIINENIVIVEKDNLGTNPSSDSSTRLKRDVNAELPPPDLVKQTLKIFETSPKRKVKPSSQSHLAKLVAGFNGPNSQPISSTTSRPIDRRKINQNKPTLSPKPVLSPEKLRRTKMGSPKRNQPLTGGVQVASRISSSSSSSRPVGLNIEREKPQVISSESSVSEKNPATSPNLLSPRSISPIVTVLANSDHTRVASPSGDKMQSLNSVVNGEKERESLHSDELEEVDSHSELSKPVPETALENIRRGGVSMQFSFNSENSQSLINKSYLPRPKSPPQALNTSLLKDKLEKSPPPKNIVVPRQQCSPQTKQVGIIRPLVSTKIPSSVSSTPALTEQEIEKNLINRVKSIEQPISKVVVAIKALPESVVLGTVSSDVVTNKTLTLSHGCANSKVKNQGLWDEKIWHSNQNTIVFNFSNRKEVPDYIENDGLILRGKRDRPRPGDGGFILLEDGGLGDADETSTEAEDLLTSAPPSPCDVTFVGDNVLINGKSNLKKTPKQVKLRIQFNDEATTMFEYPSEASLVEEEILEAVASGRGRDETGGRGRDEGDIAQASSPSASSSGAPGLSMNLGGSLGAYTPRQVGAGDWQLGVTPVLPPPAPITSPAQGGEEEDHLKPAPPEATVAWSEDTASDLLF